MKSELVIKYILLMLVGPILCSYGQEDESYQLYELDTVETVSQRIALEDSLATFSMPVSALKYEPLVDVQSRNSVESQGDVTIRGGIFENTGFMLGSATLFDPQTGHYYAEIPVSPHMLSRANVLTGSANAFSGFNSSVGSINYQWSAIRPHQELALGVGEDGYWYGSAYGAHVEQAEDGSTWGIDTEVSHSESEGPIENGDHDFDRLSIRFQRIEGSSQSDVFFGYQDKFFGWPNMYTPFGVAETEDIQTSLFFLNHRVDHGDIFWQASAYYRKNKDDYEFDRTRPGVFNPFEHTTEVYDIAFEGGWTWEQWNLLTKVEWLQDEIESTSLTFGAFNSRSYLKGSVLVDTEWDDRDGNQWRLAGGLSYDDNNRGGSKVLPMARLDVSGLPGLGDNSQLYIDVSRASQVAGYTAIAGNPNGGLFRGNPSLGRETATNYELGYLTQSDHFNFQAAVFKREDDELVDWTFAYDIFGRTANHVDIDTTGVELLASYDFDKGRVVVGYTSLSKDEDYGVANVDASFYALNFARHRATLAFIYELASGIELRSDNVFRIQQDNLLRTEGTSDDAVLSSLGLYYFPKSIEGLELGLAVVNLWDSDFEEIPSVPAAPRQISLNAAYRW
ncbi:TonB-dependent receptor [Opitutia bacterium ISCC 51]|nr:TonB-dependent receptor [Opitutae bacterium ISCC 51]QXD28778.1 TonB-dependent receptor [Opitutae bacterium ISCC 52]